jgi:hypothetical protein
MDKKIEGVFLGTILRPIGFMKNGIWSTVQEKNTGSAGE